MPNEPYFDNGRPCPDQLMHKIRQLQGTASKEQDIGRRNGHSGTGTVRIPGAALGVEREVGTKRVAAPTVAKVEGRRYHVPTRRSR